MGVSELWIVVAVAVASIVMHRLGRRAKEQAARRRQEAGARMEALFRATFPELQPHFHPARVHEYAAARQKRKASSGPHRWKNPPGFPAAAVADIQLDGLRDKVRLLDPAGATLADFVFEEHPDGAVLRLGKGKFTVNLKGPQPRVRYWHPEREFKWTPTSWDIKSGVSDHPLSSRDSDSSFSSDSSSSSSSIAAGAAVGAGIVAAGGSFDGGGASAAWDDSGGGSSSSSSGSDSSPDFSSVESGSSSTSSTSY